MSGETEGVHERLDGTSDILRVRLGRDSTDVEGASGPRDMLHTDVEVVWEKRKIVLPEQCGYDT